VTLTLYKDITAEVEIEVLPEGETSPDAPASEGSADNAEAPSGPEAM